jgi:hypothetical protein
MPATISPSSKLRAFGAVWLLLAPMLLVMASGSTVQSDFAYRVQLVACSGVALASAFLGVAALLRVRWAASGLRVLSWLGAGYFFGSACLILAWPLVPGSRAESGPIGLLLALMVAPFGLPFVFMARALGRTARNPRNSCGTLPGVKRAVVE